MQPLRLDKLRKILQEKNLEGFLVSNFFNILYLTGFKTLTENEREGWVLVTKNNIYLFTDSRYINNKSQITNDKSIINNKFLIIKLITPEKDSIKHLQEIIKEEKIQRLGFEGEDLRYGEYLRFKEQLGIELISTDKLVILQRAIKDEGEIDKIRTACQIADQCLEEIVKTIKPGTSEKEIVFKMEFWLKEKNYDLSFYPVVAVDKNSAIPHYDAKNGSNEKVKENSIILIDYGVKFQDYLSDITRMIFIGEPTGEMVSIYKILLSAQEKTIRQLKSDNNPVSVDQFCRQQLTNYQSLVTSHSSYSHSTGHGVGLQIHEYPKISFASTDVLLPNQVVTIEPAVYLKNKWGIRIEDTILIKKDGVEVLTRFSK